MNRTLLVLDDDPTGSQCVHDVDVVLELDPAPVLEVVRHPGRTCFVLTNSRARPEAEAVALNTGLVSAVLDGLAAHVEVEHFAAVCRHARDGGGPGLVEARAAVAAPGDPRGVRPWR